jgi:hypothetical protein
MFVLDTNAVSELRKLERMNRGVREWFGATSPNDLFLSVITVGEIRKGVEEKRLSDPAQAEVLDRWMARTLTLFAAHMLPVTKDIADRWGALCPGQPLSPADGLIAATALMHGMTVVTRNVADFKRSGAQVLNPWT